MIRYLLLTLFLFSYVTAFSKDVKMPKKWHTLNKLVTNEIKMLESLGRLGPTMQFRLFELYSEKLKLIREEENQKFLTSKKQVKNKSVAFKATRKQYLRTRKKGLIVLKKYPNYSRITEVLYTLAILSRDFDSSKETEKYLLKILRKKNIPTKVYRFTNIAIAEHYYNDKKYRKAIKYYSVVVQDKTDIWIAKHKYNLAWCLFKKGKKDYAINILKEGFYDGRKEGYVSSENEILTAMTIFYTNIKEIDEPLELFTKELKDPTEYLIKLAKQASRKGLHKGATKVLNRSIKINKKKKLILNLAETHIEALYIHREFSDEKKYYTSAVAIYKLVDERNKQDKKDIESKKVEVISTEMIEEAYNEINQFTGVFQDRFVKEFYQNNKQYKPEKLARVISYFNILIKLSPHKTAEFRFFQGETNYAIDEFVKASNFYIKGLQYSKREKSPDKKIQTKLLDSLLASLEESKLSRKKQNSYLKYAYQNYIKLFPKSEKSRLIYPKLSKLHIYEKKVKLAQANLELYISNFPKDSKIQRAVQTSIFDYHIANKDAYIMSDWITKLEKGYLGFEPAYTKKALIVLGNLVFETLEKLEKEGKTESLLKECEKLYYDKKFPNIIKEQAAYKAAITELNTNKSPQESSKWLERSIKKAEDKVTLSRIANIDSMTTHYYLMQDFESSYNISKIIEQKICNKKIKQKDSFSNKKINSAYILDDIDLTINSIKISTNCTSNKQLIESLKTDIAKKLLHSKRYSKYNNFKKRLNISKEVTNEANTVKQHYWSAVSMRDSSRAKEALKYLKQNKNFINTLKQFYSFREKYENFDFKMNYKDKKNIFNEEKLNTSIETIFKKIEQLTNDTKQFIEYEDANIIIGAYARLIDNLEGYANSVKKVNPMTTDKTYNKSILKAMKQISTQINNQVRDYRNASLNLIYKNDLLTPYNREISTKANNKSYSVGTDVLTININ